MHQEHLSPSGHESISPKSPRYEKST